MTDTKYGFFDRFLDNRASRLWTRAAMAAKDTPLSALRARGEKAQHMRDALNMLIQQAETRLAYPRIGSNAIAKPASADWSWRPDLWRTPLPRSGEAALARHHVVDPMVAFFHDCDQPELSFRQIRNTSESDLAAFGFGVEVYRFDGSFLSLVVDLPPEPVEGLSLRHIIQADVKFAVERPMSILGRLNVQHGPNIEHLEDRLQLDGRGTVSFEFDLAYSKLNEKRVEKAWVDFLLQDTAMNRVVFRDLTFHRRRRAAL